MELSGFSHVALTVSDMTVSKDFYSRRLGLAVLDASESYCALLVGGTGLSEVRPGLDHVSLAVPDVESLHAWQARLSEEGVACDLRRSEWGHHLNFRDPDNIAVELVVLQPDRETQDVIGRAGVA
jgi:catechol 2,3-dioxygenase-like lactoylglutathione lyase family enzyme